MFHKIFLIKGRGEACLAPTLWLFVGLFSILFSKDAFAYTDQITVKAEEAWQAVQDVLENQIKTIDHPARTLETQWAQDRIKRSRGPFKRYTSKIVQRRYRLKVKVIQHPYDTEIEIRGVFQERPNEIDYHLMAWEKVHPEIEDFDLERQLFMRILNRLELSRKGQSAPS